MDFDINNRQMLNVGAHYQATMTQQQDWQPMSSAPRDGTVIEVRNTYGVAPTYSLAKWTVEDFAHGRNGPEAFTTEQPAWVKVPDGGGWISERSLQWRPYSGDVGGYVDPTGGAQNSPAYWRGAVAAKYGLPVDHFEKQTERNVRADTKPEKRGFWSRLFGG